MKTPTMTLFAFASLALISACGGTQQMSCPGDGAPLTCSASDLCCNETKAYVDCAARNSPAVCGSDGKTDAKKAEAACPNESALVAACLLTQGQTCDSFAKKDFVFVAQPQGFAADASGSAKISTLDSGLGSGITCQVLDSSGSVVPDRCNWAGLLAADTVRLETLQRLPQEVARYGSRNHKGSRVYAHSGTEGGQRTLDSCAGASDQAVL